MILSRLLFQLALINTLLSTLPEVALAAAAREAYELKESRPAAVGMSAARLNQLDQVVKTSIERGETPGAVLMVARKGRIVYKKAFGHRALVPEREPMTVDTVFDLASLTKVIATAASIMILVENGELSLTDPVSSYVPEFARHEKGNLTILGLLTHYSGLRPDVDLDQPWTGYETGLERAFEEQLIAPPGERFIYSDINYFVLSEVVRKVTGKGLDEFASDRIFRPLGMKSTRFNPSATPRVAPTELRDGKMLRGEVHDPTANRMGGVAGHAGLFSTAEDVAVYAQMILNGGEYGKNRILSPLSILKMTTPQSPLGQTELRGIGFDIRTRFSANRGDLFPVGSFGHTGFTGTSLWIDPLTQTFVVLLTSRLHPEGKGDVTSLRKKVASVVAASIVEGLPTLRSSRSDTNF